MTSQNKKCPSQKQLSNFNLGKLSEKSIEAISRHLKTCTVCEASVETANDSNDWLVVNLQKKPGQIDRKDEAELKEVLAKVAAAIPVSTSEKVPVEDSQSEEGMPESIGDYQLVRKIGEGGMGFVYEAVHAKLGKHVAIKLLRTQKLESKSSVGRFEREMQAVGKLDHPNIVRATDAGEVDGIHYLVMELVDGESLSEVVSQNGPLETADACELIRQAAIGLQHVHQHGLIHRDLKASNLMLSKNGIVKILDLGLARLGTSVNDEGEMTQTGIILGTIDYMAPEQIADPRSVDIRSDLYSLGCTLFKLLSGQVVFPNSTHSNPYSKMYAHQTQPIPDINDFRDDVPERLSDLLDKLVAKEPDERFATPAVLVKALEPFVIGSDLPTLASSIKETKTDLKSQSTIHPMASMLSDTFIADRPKSKRKKRSVSPQSNGEGGFFGNRKRTILSAAGGAAAILLGILLYFNTGEGRVRISINEPDVKLLVDGVEDPKFKFESPGKEPVIITLPTGSRKLEITKKGFKSQIEIFKVTRNGSVEWEVVLEPKSDQQIAGAKPPLSVKKQVRFKETAQFRKRLAEVPYQDPFDEKVIALRKELIEHEKKNHGLPLGVEVSRLMSHIAWPVDALKRENISEYELARLGNGLTNPRGMAAVVGVLGDSRMMHWSGLLRVFWMPDGKKLMSISGSSVRIWDTESGEELNSYWINYFTGGRASLSPDGKILVVPNDHTEPAGFKFHDAHTGEIQSELSMPELLNVKNPVYHSAISHDGKFLAVANMDYQDGGDLSIWDLKTRKLKQFLQKTPTLSAKFSPDGKLLASGEKDGVLKLWDLETGKTRFVIKDLKVEVRDIAFSPDGNSVVVPCNSGNATKPKYCFRSYDTNDGKQNWEAHSNGYLPSQFVYHPNGSLLYAAGVGSAVWDAETGKKKFALKDIPRRVGYGAFSPDGKILVTGDSYGAVRLWNSSTGKEILLEKYQGQQSKLSVVRVHPDGNLIATGGSGNIKLWDMATCEPKDAVDWGSYSGTPSSLIFHPTKSRLGVLDGASFGVGIWDYENKNPLKIYNFTNGGAPYSFQFSNENDKLFSGGYSELNEYDLKTEQTIKKTNLQRKTSIGNCAFRPDGKAFASASDKGEVTVYDVPSFKIKSEYQMKIGPFSHPEMIYSPDGQTLILNCEGGILVDAETGEKRPLSGKTNGFRYAFSPDGKYIAVAGNSVAIFDLESGEPILNFVLGQMWSIAFTPDSRHIITGNANGTAYIIRLKHPESIQAETSTN